MGAVVVRIRLDVAVVHSFDILLNLHLLRLDKVSDVVLLPNREEDLKHRLVAGPLELKNIDTIPDVDAQLADSIFEVHASGHQELCPQIACGTAVLQMLSPKQENPSCADVFLYLPHDISEAPKAPVGLQAKVGRLHEDLGCGCRRHAHASSVEPPHLVGDSRDLLVQGPPHARADLSPVVDGSPVLHHPGLDVLFQLAQLGMHLEDVLTIFRFVRGRIVSLIFLLVLSLGHIPGSSSLK
mmetsp:Transcript_40023/g.95576  ORF Transcript_40023/g.95576 Transcript_40023/m.95576 type:complete len:240 (-) Transcript_40023:319-1038(-)